MSLAQALKEVAFLPRTGPTTLRNHGARRAATALAAAPAPLKEAATVAFVVATDPSAPRSPFGETSPQPHPTWAEVAAHMCERMPNFDPRLAGVTVPEADLCSEVSGTAAAACATVAGADMVLLLGCHRPDAPQRLEAALLSGRGGSGGPVAVLAHACSDAVLGLQRVDIYRGSGGSPLVRWWGQNVPWSRAARGKRLLAQAELLLRRNSSEDLLFALFFVLGAYVVKDLELVREARRSPLSKREGRP